MLALLTVQAPDLCLGAGVGHALEERPVSTQRKGLAAGWTHPRRCVIAVCKRVRPFAGRRAAVSMAMSAYEGEPLGRL